MGKKVDKKELRNFGLSLGVVCLLWAGILWWKGATAPIPWLLGAAPVLALLALVAPVALWPIHKVWMPVAHAIAKVLTWLMLTLAFYLVFTPYGVIMRLLGRDPLQRRIDRGASTYWTRRENPAFDPDRLRKQY
ncbi:MAG TPA: SxtJ family membrane protein [bacterium]|nr:SxtJ family membrane protein [bacterium]